MVRPLTRSARCSHGNSACNQGGLGRTMHAPVSDNGYSGDSPVSMPGLCSGLSPMSLHTYNTLWRSAAEEQRSIHSADDTGVPTESVVAGSDGPGKPGPGAAYRGMALPLPA